MPTDLLGPWYGQAVARGLIRTPERPQDSAPLIDALPAGASEKRFQAAVIRLAEANGWRVYHTHDSRRSAAGYPDLTLVRKGVLILAELKTDVGRLSGSQDEWLADLRAVPGVRVRLWRPAMWAAIVAELAE